MTTVSPEPGTFYPSPPPTNGAATAALIVSVFALIFSWVPFLSLILAAVALVCAGIAMKTTRTNAGIGKGSAIAGLVLGSVAALVGTLVTLAAVAVLNDSAPAHPDTENILNQELRGGKFLGDADKPGTGQQAFLDGDDGTYKVGTDVDPGTYVSAGGRDDFVVMCSWERLRGPGHTLEEFIDANAGPGQNVLTVEPSDAYVRTTGCKPFVKQQ